MESLYPPIVSILIIYAIFTFLLNKRFGKNIFCELGFLYISLLILYTVIPGAALIFLVSASGDPLSLMLDMLSIKEFELGIHFWRHFLFIFSFSIGYLIYRGRESMTLNNLKINNHSIVVLLIIIIFICLLFLSSLSAPVDSYYDSYIRYDHLPFLLRKLASILIRFKNGFYAILLTLMFSNYYRYRRLIPIIVLFICFYELFYSHGARIIVFIILLQVFFLYNYFVKSIIFKKLILYSFGLMLLFSSVEIVRLLNVDAKEAKNLVEDEGIKAPAELGAIFITSLHLYTERRNGTLPKTEWQMFFYDFISPFTFNSFTEWNPIYWYANYYTPGAEVPAFTLGPIANSAIWGGEIDLFFRGLVNGIFFAYITRWFLKRRKKWWAVSIYTFLFSYSVITLKYSVFFYLTPLIKDILPTLIIVAILMEINAISKNNSNKYLDTPN